MVCFSRRSPSLLSILFSVPLYLGSGALSSSEPEDTKEEQDPSTCPPAPTPEVRAWCKQHRGQGLIPVGATHFRVGLDGSRGSLPAHNILWNLLTYYFFNLNQRTNAKSSTSCLSFPNDSGYISIFSAFFGCKTGEHRGMHQFIGSAKAAIKENPQTHEKPQFWLAMFP